MISKHLAKISTVHHMKVFENIARKGENAKIVQGN